MKGSMDDLAGRIWTWLIQEESPRAISEIMIGVNHCQYDDILEAVRFWVDCKEFAVNRDYGTWMYSVLNAKDPERDNNV
jgi:hypothetical protein